MINLHKKIITRVLTVFCNRILILISLICLTLIAGQIRRKLKKNDFLLYSQLNSDSFYVFEFLDQR